MTYWRQKTMTKTQKIGLDGKMHDYWQFSEAELEKMREKRAEQEAKRRENK